MAAVWTSTPEAVRDALDRLVRENPEVANDVVSVSIPILLDSGEVLRGVKVIVLPDAKAEAVTPEKLETWGRDGWVDPRLASCARWVDRFQKIRDEIAALPQEQEDSSSRFLRNRRFWHKVEVIQPGKVVGVDSGDGGRGSRIKR
jgi:hypothetical protein